MATVSTYLNFLGTTEQAFEFYKSVFGTDYLGEPMRMGDAPTPPGMPELSDTDKRAIMHVALPILGGHVLMGTDVLESMNQSLTTGDNVSIMLAPDTKDEADALFAKLSEGGSATQPMKDEFWGDYFGQLRDRFGINWMINVPGTPPA